MIGRVIRAIAAEFSGPDPFRDALVDLCSELGGTFESESAGFFGRKTVLDLPRGDILVRIDEEDYRMKNEGASFGPRYSVVPCLRVRAGFLLGRGPVFEVFHFSRASLLSALDGLGDTELGSELFDRNFVVKTPHANGTRIAWTARARALMQGFPRGVVYSTGKQVTLATKESLRHRRRVLEGVELVAELASYGRAFAEELRASADSYAYTAPSGAFGSRSYPSVTVVSGGTTIELAPFTDDAKRLGVVATTALGIAESSPALALGEDGRIEPPPKPGLVPGDARNLVPGFAPATLRFEGGAMTLAFHGEITRARLRAGVSFVALVASAQRSAGVYR